MSFLRKEETGLWVVDVQEKLFPQVDRACGVLEKICFVLDAAAILQLPLIVTEQYPKGLGKTVEPVYERIYDGHAIYPKTSFSGLADPTIRHVVESRLVNTWILVGIEAHICVLQTAKDLLQIGKSVVVLNDAISSRSIFDFSTAIGEIRDGGGRISSSETVVYEIIRDAASPEFKKILPLVASS